MTQQVESLLAAIHEGIQADGEYGPHKETCQRAENALRALKERLETQDKVIQTLKSWMDCMDDKCAIISECAIAKMPQPTNQRIEIAKERLAAWEYK